MTGTFRRPKPDDTGDILWLLSMSAMLFVVLLPFSSYVAALSLIQGEWEINNTQAGAIFSAYLAGYAFSALFIIPLTDRVEPRYVLIGSVIVSVVAQSLFPLAAHGTASGVVLRAVAGVGLVGVYMPGLRLIAERFADRGRGMAMGVYVTAFYAANSASLVATGLLMSSYEWRDAYLILAIASAASIPIVYLLLRKHVHPPSAQSSGRLDFSVLKSRPVRYFMLGYGLHGLELYAVRVWLPAFLVATLISRGVDAAQAAVTAATVGGIALAVGAAGPLMGGIMSDRWGRAATASAIFALSGLCSWTFGWTGGLPWGVVLSVAIVYGWAIAADSSIYSTAVTEVTAPGQLGSAMAIQAFMGFSGGTIGPILVGGVLDVFPDSMKWGLGFSFMGVLAVIAIVGLMRVRSTPQALVAAAGES